MENKPIVTCHGDQTLFSKLHPLVKSGLGRDKAEWKRSYGRPSRAVTVEATFVPFNPSILPSKDDWNLLGRPFFHTYWTDCDVEGYKSGVKEDISDWLASLREKDCPDWQIIVVMNEDSWVKSRLLRNSVYDKVKNDFCNKLPERCLVLSEPLKNDAKASESWNNVLVRMRQLLLESFNRNLGIFEDHMRLERNHRTAVNWSYCTYFLLQEELAFMYEMLGLYEDALVQYDELDALLTQFVVNFSIGDSAPWLVNFSKHPATRWDGLCLSQPINIAKRQMIKHQEASILDLRNYLFSRQCYLLFALSRSWEVGQRAIPFMHNCIKELHILEISLPEGALDCWVYLSCLEVLNMCEQKTKEGKPDALQPESYSLHTANLWDYARTKIYCLGEVSGLLHSGSPSSNELLLVVELLTGLVRTEGDSEPLQLLREALSSKEAFHKRYLELSELAMCSFKHIGRLRSARKVGRDLASFHILLNEPEKAESYLHDAVKMFKAEGWEMLADDTRKSIAWCQKATKQTTKYCRTCMYITSSPTLPNETRLQYQRELETLGSNNPEAPLLVRCAPVFYVSKIEPESDQFTSGNPCSVKLNLLSNLAEPINVDSICVSIIFWTPVVDSASTTEQSVSRRRSQPNVSGLSRHTSGSDRFGHSREPSGSSVVGIDLYNRIQETIQASSQPLDLHAIVELKSEGDETASSGVMCRSPLRRLRSIPGVTKEKEIIKEEWDLVLTAAEKVVKPGVNEVVVTSTLTSPGCYLISQLCIKFNGIECFKNLTTECVTLLVVSSHPAVTLEPENDPLVAGLHQRIQLSFDPLYMSDGCIDPLVLKASDGLLLSSVHLNSDDGTLKLPESREGERVQFDISAFAWIPDGVDDFVCHEVTLFGGAMKEKIVKNLKFVLPFRITHLIHTSFTRKFVQVVVVGCIDMLLELLEPRLSSSDKSISFVSMFALSHPFGIKKDQNASFLWEIQMNESFADARIPCCFDVRYRMQGVESPPQQIHQSLTLENFTTLFTVNSTLIPVNAEDNLNNGLAPDKTYTLRVTVNSVNDKAKAVSPLFYEIVFNEKDWVVTGDTKGEAVLVNGLVQILLSAQPQKCGYLYLPGIRLFRKVTVSKRANEAALPTTASDGELATDSIQCQPNMPASEDSVKTSVAVDGPVLSEDNLVRSEAAVRSRQKHTMEMLSDNEVYNSTRAQQVHVRDNSAKTIKHLQTEITL